MLDQVSTGYANAVGDDRRSTCALEWAELRGTAARLGVLLQRQTGVGIKPHSNIWQRLQTEIDQVLDEREQIMHRILTSVPVHVAA